MPQERRDSGIPPRAVRAAARITELFSSMTALVVVWVTLEVVEDQQAFMPPVNAVLVGHGTVGESLAGGSFALVVAGFGLVVAWCVLAWVLAVLALRRHNAARISLAASAALAGGLVGLMFRVDTGPFGTPAFLGLVPWLLACLAVPVLLFTPAANGWYGGHGEISRTPGPHRQAG